MRAATPKRALLALTACALALLALPTVAAAEPAPWWQLITGARPTNLPPAPGPTEVQEVQASTAEGSLAARVQVGGVTVGCLGKGPLAFFCGATGFGPTETAAGFETMLEAPYGAGEVEVSGGPVDAAPFTITTPGRWVVPVQVTPLKLGIIPVGSVQTTIAGEGAPRLTLTLTNLGNAPADGSSIPLEISDKLPDGALPFGIQAEAGGQGKSGPVDCAIESASQVGCSFEDLLPPYEAIEVEVLVALAPGAGTGEAGKVSVSGGEGPSGAQAPSQSVAQALNISSAPVPFGLEHFSMRAEQGNEGEEEGGEEVTRAGSHPFQLTTTIVANAGAQKGAGRRDATVLQPALPRNLRFTLPAGFVGDATAVPTCDLATFLHQTAQLVNECPDQSAIGVSSVTIIESVTFGLARLAVPVFNLPPAPGEPARFGLMVAGVPVVVDTALDPGSYRIAAEVRNISQVAQFLSSTTTIWGDPGAKSHDGSRGWNCVASYIAEAVPGECEAPLPSERDESPFLRLPDHCVAALRYEALFEAWNGDGASAADEAQAPLRACNGIPFSPEISSSLTSRLAANPSGQDFELRQEEAGFGQTPQGTPEAQAKRVAVTLPEGVTINPSAAEGLAVCTEADLAREQFDSPPGAGCPQASQVGTVEAATPLIEERLEGELFVAEPYANPPGSLLALYLVVRSPARGILVRQPLELMPDERTGRLVAIAENAPPIPYTNLRLRLREGGRAPLITPPGCGTFHTIAALTPWSASDPDNPRPEEIFSASAPFTIERGVDGGPCPSGAAPFAPGFSAGTLSNQAAAYSPFLMRLTRADGEQDMTRFSAVLPPGVVGKIAGLGRCPESGIARAASRQGAHGGAEEKADPSCPPASRIGSTLAGAGVGNQLTYVPGSLYLAGPYNGDPLSVVAITPAVAGPFDAGTVVVREALTLNPRSGEVEVDGSASDPIPHILKGIPLSLRDLRISVDRPDFTLNATSCEEEKTRLGLSGGGTALAPLPDHAVELSDRYQAAGCRALGFRPRLAISLKGGTKRGAHPALKALVRPRQGDANFSSARVTLPHSAFLDQGHIRTICTRVQFNAPPGNGAHCPKGAVYGQAKAWTPLLDEPLSGPVFLRSSNHNLPDLVIALHGIVDIELTARIDSIHGGIRTTFTDIPDAPVSRFLLDMQGAQKGLIVNSRDLCAKPGQNKANADLEGQNGRAYRKRPLVKAAGCPKPKRHRR